MAAAIGTIIGAIASGTTSVTTGTITSVTGETLVYCTQGDPGVTFNTPSDSKGNTPTVLSGGVLATGSIKQGVWVQQNGVGGASHTATHTVSSAIDFTVWFGNITGVGTAPLDAASSQNTDTTSAYETTTGTLGQADSLAVTFITSNSPSNPTVYSESTGFAKTNEEQNGSTRWSGAVFTKSTAATTALTPSVTITGGATDTVIACVVLASGAAAVGPRVYPQLGGPIAAGPFGLSLLGTADGSVTAALTGAAATGAIGTVALAADKAITGNAGASAVGTVSAQASKALAGNVATGSVGSVTPVRAGAITGAAATATPGTVAPSTAKALTGNAATGSTGTVSSQASQALTGTSGTSAAGSVAPSVTIPITGVSATGSVGTVTAETGGSAVSVALTGVAATAQTGTASPSVAVGLTGASAAGAVGSVAVDASATQALTGVAATGTAGAVAPSVTVALFGVSATGQVGDISAGQILSGVEATGTAGTIVPSTSAALTGSEAAGEAGFVGLDVTVALTGVDASGQVGTIAFVTDNVTIALTGVQATGAVGVLEVAGEFTEIAAAVWSYVLSNGKTAGQNVVEIRAMLDLLAPDFWNFAIEGTYTAADLLRVIAAVQAGKSSITALGGGAATVEFRAVDDSETRVTAAMQGSERTEVTLNVD